MVIYTNNLVYPEGSNPFPLIVHRYLWKVDVQCDLSRNDVIEHHFRPNQTTVQEHHHVEGASHYSIQLKFFKDPAFYQEITGEPISAKTGRVQCWSVPVTPNLRLMLTNHQPTTSLKTGMF
ncbi:hypothetical protein CHS0354_038034 [Potamilus streckersoni]|uniref:Uncharacterized protein n=1 Tax=Potamilus streckersoni TaxID=2493646 RepID=A0AAE0SRG9_9BIVA|nr:hypothetical protein CHS0354_038034 [Potamilus streckersoni]